MAFNSNNHYKFLKICSIINLTIKGLIFGKRYVIITKMFYVFIRKEIFMKHSAPNRSFRILAFILAIFLLLPSVCLLTIHAADNVNIAQGKRAIACHNESASLTPNYALDGNTNSRFAAGGGCPDKAWYVLDLGATYDVSRIRINWEAAHPSAYTIEISNDGQTFTKIKDETAADAGWKETAISGRGRFIRIQEVTRALAPYGMSMWELEVYGKEVSGVTEKTYHQLTAETPTGGSIALSHSGFVADGTEVTITAIPAGNNAVDNIFVNGETVAVTDNKATFTVTGDVSVSATFVVAPADRFECEDARVLDTDGKTPITITRLADPDASGGMVAGGTGGKHFIFENVVESNIIHIAYASPHTNSMTVSIRYPDAEDFAPLCNLPFSTSNSWDMKSSYIAASTPVYIPEGSDIMVRPNVDCNLDYIFFTYESAATPDKAPANTVTADKLSDKAVEDLMSPYGVAVKLAEGESISIKVPEGMDAYNVMSFTYMAEADAKVKLMKGNATLGKLSLGKTPLRAYRGLGMRTGGDYYEAGDTLTLTCTEGELWLASVTVNFADQPTGQVIFGLPGEGERLTINLDGIWAVDTSEISNWAVPETVPTLGFANSILVPGLWHDAAYDLGDYTSSMTWYKKIVTFEKEPTGQVLLSIGAAQYGRYIYVNGQYVDCYEYNYSPSLTDLTGLLHKGDNEIVIMLGSWSNQVNNANTPAHVLYDGESTEDEPGITDTVSLIFNREPDITAVQVAPDIEKGSVTVKATLTNRTDADVTTDVTVTVYELGIFQNGEPVKRKEIYVGETVKSGVTVKASGTLDVTIDAVTLSDWTKDKCWSPDNPYLYRVEIKTSGDTHTVRFGMRTFEFDPETGYARLNGEIFYLFGTNVAIERYYDDPLCGNTPWEEDWIRKLYSEFKDVNWVSFRTHLGHANSKWFDIADEMGMMIFDEYPIWGNVGNDTLQTILPEIYAWIDSRGYHPSLVVFDAQNEATYDLPDQFIKKGREYDIQGRPWENGWRPPVGENDPIECHPYIIGTQGISGLENMNNTSPIVTTADIGWTADQYKGHPFIINEHGEYWINREGAAMSGTAGTWNSALPGATNEQRLIYYADLMAAQIEAFRAGRAYAGIQFFCGLGSSFPSAVGVTSDILSPDVSTAEALEIRPYIKSLLKNSFADLGIVIDTYTEKRNAGASVRVPVTLVNDTGADITDLPVTIVVKSGDTVLYADRKLMSVSAFSASNQGITTETFSFNIPNFKGYCEARKELTVEAYYQLNDETVTSQRKWTLQSGTLTDTEPPVYDWLKSDTALPGDEVISDTEPSDTGTTDTSMNQPETDPADLTSDATNTSAPLSDTEASSENTGCASAVAAGLSGVMVLAAAVALKKKRE